MRPDFDVEVESAEMQPADEVRDVSGEKAGFEPHAAGKADDFDAEIAVEDGLEETAHSC